MFDIKETLNPQGNVACQSRLDQLLGFRKLLLIYRLVHFNDLVPDVNTGLKRRNRELCKPILQLFYDCSIEIQIEIKSMLEHFLSIKKHRKENTIEVALYPIIINLVSEHGTELPASFIWHKITAGGVDGYYDGDRRPNEYQTADYGTIYRNSITNIICDKFGAQRRHMEKGNVLIFDIDKLAKIGRSYDLETNIQLKLPIGEMTEGSEGSEGFREEATSPSKNSDVEITNKHSEYNRICEQIPNNTSNNTTPRVEKVVDIAIKPSDPSEPSGSNSLPDISKGLTTGTIYRLGRSDNFGCKNCKVRGDRFFMEAHVCRA